MNRVVIINLAGRAIHVEEAGESLIAGWLGRSSAVLADDPDRGDIMNDFEALIAERLIETLEGGAEVVTESSVAGVLASIGEVPSSGASVTAPAASEADEQSSRVDEGQLAPRRFYRLSEESKISGVCTGIAAYFNVDVTIVRIMFVFLAFVTSVFALLAYLIIWVVAPLATTSAERAAVSGAGTTAADVSRRVRESARPALASVGEALRRIGAVVRPVVYGLTVVLIFSIGLAYGWAVAEQMAGSLNIISGVSADEPWWLVQLWLVAAVWLLVAPVFLVNRLCRKPSEGRSRVSATMLTVGSTAWFAALLIVVAVPLANSSQLRSLAVEGSGRIMLGGDEYCFTPRADRWPQPHDEGRLPAGCRSGDEVIYISVS